MAFGYIRLRNLNPSKIEGTEKHNERIYPDGKVPKNINSEETKWNGKEYFLSWTEDQKKFSQHAPEEMTLAQVIDHRLNQHNIKLKSNQNCAIEFVVGASKDFWEKYTPDGHFSNCHKFLENKYGKGSVVAKSSHLDETNPHCHFIVVPIQEKEIKWKNRSGLGSRKESRLAIREATGGREKLRTLQDDYFKFIEPYGRRFGVEFKRGKLKERGERDKYIKYTNHELTEFTTQLNAITSDLSNAKEKLVQIAALEEKTRQIEENKAKTQKEDVARRKNFKRGINSDFDNSQTNFKF